MNNLHAKSPCCREKIYRFGSRRRQCSNCHKTWRIRRKRVGRKSKRESTRFLIRYLHHEVPSLYARAKAYGTSDDHLRIRLNRSLNHFLRTTSWPRLPRKRPLIVIADAMVCFLDGRWYTFYFIVLRKPNDSQAVIVRPYIKQGTEVWVGWLNAFSKLPPKVKNSIVALVCDGHSGLVNTAKRESWILQRCHFHLISRLQSRRSKWRYSRHSYEGKLIYRLVREVLTTPSPEKILPCIEKLREIGQTTSSREVRSILLGFSNNYPDYRTYLLYPKLHLPKTSNAIESMIGSIQSLRSRARGFRTRVSLIKWVNAVLKNKQTITCNGYYQPN